MRLRYAYGTNGLADHRLQDALAMLADHGYAGVALTLDHAHFDPFADDVAGEVAALRRRLDLFGLDVVLETGARFLLDPRRKHEPTLLSDTGRQRRLDLLLRAVDIAADLGAPVVHCWSGARPPTVGPDVAWDRLVTGCAQLLTAADRMGVDVAFEPEPGMLVATIADYERLLERLDGHPRFKLTLDIGHCRCLEETAIPACVSRATDRLAHVQIEDMRRGVHEHLRFGHGDIDFPPVLAALTATGYGGLVSVELPRHSHAAHRTVPESIAFLRSCEARGGIQ